MTIYEELEELAHTRQTIFLFQTTNPGVFVTYVGGAFHYVGRTIVPEEEVVQRIVTAQINLLVLDERERESLSEEERVLVGNISLDRQPVFVDDFWNGETWVKRVVDETKEVYEQDEWKTRVRIEPFLKIHVVTTNPIPLLTQGEGSKAFEHQAEALLREIRR
jgi:hypothetical protein